MQEDSAEVLALKALTDYITENGLRKTLEREAVLKTIYNMEDKVSIEDILQKHQELFPNIHICRSTVYNCIRILLDASVINELKDKNSTVYCKVYGNQNLIELTCRHCRETKLISNDYIASQLYNIGISDFKIENFRFQLYGICAKCKACMDK